MTYDRVACAADCDGAFCLDAFAMGGKAGLGHGEEERSDCQRGDEVNSRHLIASGLVGEPTAPVIGIAGATNMNS